MHKTLRAGRLAVVAGVAVGMAVVGMSSAFAATAKTATTPAASLSAGFGDVVLAPSGFGKTVDLTLSGTASAVTTFQGITVQIDVSGLAGIATVAPLSSACTTAGTLVTCTAADFKAKTPGNTALGAAPFSGGESIPLTFTGVTGAAAGTSVNVPVSVTASGSVSTVGYPGTVSLADGPDLVIDTPEPAAPWGSAPSVAVSAGSTYSRSLKFTNDGDQAAQGVTVEVLSSGYGLDVPEQRKGCEYAAPDVAYCYFADLVAPGATESLSPALQFLTSTDLMWQGVSVEVVPGYASLQAYTVGTGKAFSLVDSTGAAQVPVTGQQVQSNIDSPPQWTANLKVAAATADYAAQAMIFQQPGDNEYDVQPNVTNLGTGYINLGESLEYELTVDVTVPSGVGVLSVQSDWTPVVNGAPDSAATGQAGYSEYVFNAGINLSGDGQYFDSSPGQFVVQAQPGFAGGTGTVTVGVNRGSASALTSAFGNIDTDTSNDTATFDVPAYS